MEQQNLYNNNPTAVNKSTAQGVGVAALICGILCFFFNPMYLTCLAAVILGIIGCVKNNPKGMAVAGLILGILGLIFQFVFDLVFTILTLGMGFLVFFI